MANTKELAACPEVLRQLLDTSPYPLALCGQEGRIVYAGQALAGMLRQPAAQLVGQPSQALLPDQPPQLLGQAGPALWLYSWLRPLAHPGHEAQIQQILSENRSFRLAMDQIGLTVFEYRIDRDEMYLLAAGVAAGEEDAVLRGGPERIASYIHASEEDALFLADAFANAAFGRSGSLDLRAHLNEDEQWLRLTLCPILRGTQTTGTVIGTIQDITSQKLAEQRVSRESAFRMNVLSGISSDWELELERNCWSYLWNGEPALAFIPEPQQYHGDYDRFLSDTLRPLIHPDDWAAYAAIMERGALLARFRRGESACSAEYRIRKRPAAEADYEWRSVNVLLSRDAQTLQPKASCHVTDITPQKASLLEAQREKRVMERAAREARRANARKSQFLADTSRTLHAPLQAMVGASELALMEQMSDTAREYLQQIHDFGDDLTRLLGDALALTDTQPQPSSAREEYSPLALMQDVANILSQREPDRSLSVGLEGEVPSGLSGDGMRLRQALLDLAGTALRTSPEVSLRFACQRLDSEHVQAVLTLLDRHSTLPPDELTNLFVAFSQAAHQYGGDTGLALSQARQLVRLMDGTLEAVPAPGGGIAFVLRVPQQVIDPRPLHQ